MGKKMHDLLANIKIKETIHRKEEFENGMWIMERILSNGQKD
jgi:hypothetical protein